MPCWERCRTWQVVVPHALQIHSHGSEDFVLGTDGHLIGSLDDPIIYDFEVDDRIVHMTICLPGVAVYVLQVSLRVAVTVTVITVRRSFERPGRLRERLEPQSTLNAGSLRIGPLQY
jgi:hypothetical protein